MKGKPIFYLCLLIFVQTSCTGKRQGHITLSIENDNLKSFYCTNGFESENTFEEQFNNKVSISLKNNSNITYILIPNCINQNNTGCSFNATSGFLSLDNTIIRENNKQIEIEPENSFFHPSYYEVTRDSIVQKHFRRLGYKNFEVNLLLKNFIKENTIILPANSTLFFENFISLPLNFHPNEIGYEEIKMIYSKNYTVSIALFSDVTSIKHLLTKSMLKTLENNNIEIFDGQLISNEIPIILIEK